MPVSTTPAASQDVRSDIDIARVIAPSLGRALVALGEHEAAEIEASLSVPVGRNAAGTVIERSAPGEPPRMEYGVLRANVGSEVEGSGGAGELPSLKIFASRPPENAGDDPDAAVILETELNRPFMAPAASRLEGYAAEFIAGQMKASSQ